MTRHARPLALFVALASGCTVDSLLNRLENESEKSIDLACSCTNVFPDRAACEAQFKSFSESFDRDCLEDALAEDKRASKETLKCTLDQAKAFNRCLEDRLDCNDGSSIEGCTAHFEAECPELPQAVEARLGDCYRE